MGKPNYPGLPPSEWEWLRDALAEMIAYSSLPVTYHRVVTAPDAFDDLYQEAATPDGEPSWADVATITTWVQFRPQEEVLTRLGLLTAGNILMFLASDIRRQWETVQSTPLGITEDMEFTVQGVRYNIVQLTDDWMPEDFFGVQTLGTLILGKTKPRG